MLVRLFLKKYRFRPYFSSIQYSSKYEAKICHINVRVCDHTTAQKDR